MLEKFFATIFWIFSKAFNSKPPSWTISTSCPSFSSAPVLNKTLNPYHCGEALVNEYFLHSSTFTITTTTNNNYPSFWWKVEYILASSTVPHQDRDTWDKCTHKNGKFVVKYLIWHAWFFYCGRKLEITQPCTGRVNNCTDKQPKYTNFRESVSYAVFFFFPKSNIFLDFILKELTGCRCFYESHCAFCGKYQTTLTVISVILFR